MEAIRCRNDGSESLPPFGVSVVESQTEGSNDQCVQHRKLLTKARRKQLKPKQFEHLDKIRVSKESANEPLTFKKLTKTSSTTATQSWLQLDHDQSICMPQTMYIQPTVHRETQPVSKIFRQRKQCARIGRCERRRLLVRFVRQHQKFRICRVRPQK